MPLAMTTKSSVQNSGGFLSPDLPDSSSPSSSAFSNVAISLPQSRSNPLKPGSSKESSFILYVDQKLLEISRRYEKRFNVGLEGEPALTADGLGYENFDEVVRDLENVVDVVWVSGTPSLQKPYLLTVALNVNSYLPSFSFSPRPTFQLLRKLDMAFTSLLQGVNVETGLHLSGFQGGRGNLSTTEKVRLRGLVEGSRLAVVEVAGRSANTNDAGSSARSRAETDDELTTDDDMMDNEENDEGSAGWEMEIARVYERTLVELGVSLNHSEEGFG